MKDNFLTIKQMEWLQGNGFPLDNVIVYYSEQRISSSGSDDSRYLRVRADNSPVPSSGLKCISALELFKRLPIEIEGATKTLKESGEDITARYIRPDTDEVLVIDSMPISSRGDIRDAVFNLGVILKEKRVWL